MVNFCRFGVYFKVLCNFPKSGIASLRFQISYVFSGCFSSLTVLASPWARPLVKNVATLLRGGSTWTAFWQVFPIIFFSSPPTTKLTKSWAIPWKWNKLLQVTFIYSNSNKLNAILKIWLLWCIMSQLSLKAK